MLNSAAELSDNTTKAEILNQVLMVVNNIQNQEFRSYALVQAAVFAKEISNVAKANELMAQALNLAESVPQDWAKAGALSAIANNYYEHQFNERNAEDLFRRILNAAGTIQGDSYRFGALVDVIWRVDSLPNQVVGKELLNQTLTMINDFEEITSKTQGLFLLAHGYRTLSEETTAKELLLQILTTADSIEDPYSQRAVLSQFVLSTAEFLDREITHDLLKQGLTYVNAQQDVSLQITMLTSLAGDYRTTVDGVSALERLNQALMAVDKLSGQDEAKAEALYQVTNVLHTLSLKADPVIVQPDSPLVQQLLGQVLDTAGKLQDSEIKEIIFLLMAEVIGELPNDVAEAFTQQLMAIVPHTPTPQGQVMILSAIVSIHIDHSNETAAQTTLNQALALVRTIQDDSNQFLALSRLAAVAVKLSNEADGQALLSEGLTIVANMEEDQYKAGGLTMVLRASTSLSDGDSVQKLFNQTLTIADTMTPENEGYKTNVFGTMARTLMSMVSDSF